MNEESPDQPAEENEAAKQSMGEEHACKLTVEAAQENEGQMADTEPESNLEIPLLEDSLVPSVGVEILEARNPNHKETVETKPRDAVGNTVVGLNHPAEHCLEPLEDDKGDKAEAKYWDIDPLPVNGESGLDKGKKLDVLKISGRNGRSRRRRRINDLDDNWSDWPVLGDGWKRKEVFRRSGFTVGKADTYYLSPNGERVRSKIKMVKCLAGTLDLSLFDFKSGKFLDKNAAKRKHQKRENPSTPDKGETLEETSYPVKCHSPECPDTCVSEPTEPQLPVTSPERPQVTPPRVTVVPEKAVSPQVTVAAQRNSTSPLSSCGGLSMSPHPAKASPLRIGTPLKRVSSNPSLSLGAFSPPALSAPTTPNTETILPHLSPPWLDPVLAPLSPNSSPERDCDGALPDQATSHFPVFQSPSAANNSVADSPDASVPLNGETTPLDHTSSESLFCCMNCGNSFTGTELGRLDPPSLCPSCRPEENPVNTRNIVFRKWLPCGQCHACQVTEDCGMCASCRHGLLHPGSPKPVCCRRRKCLCPIRKVGRRKWVLGRPSETQEESSLGQQKIVRKTKILKKKRMLRTSLRRHAYEKNRPFKKQYSISQYIDSEDFSQDFENADEEGGPRKRSRRACWKCDACLRMTDCGKCDFCMDKPKFGGRNKKRQKCRLRQCQSQAMRHLLPFQLGQTKSMATIGWVGRGRRRGGRSRYGSGRGRRKSRAPWENYSFFDEAQNMKDKDDNSVKNDKDENNDYDNYVNTLQSNYSIDKENEKVLEVGVYKHQAPGKDTAQLAQVVSIMNFDSSHGRLDTQALYINSSPLSVQDGFMVNNSPLDMMRIREVPARVTDAAHVTLQLRSSVVHGQAGHLPTLPPNSVNRTVGLGIATGVHVVEVDPGESNSTPVITEIFSLADSNQERCMVDHELLALLEDLRLTVLPAHWVGLLVKGPQLQLLQCSKLSTMADTILQIEPGFFYQIRVQDQPLLLTHTLYEAHPPRLTSVPEVVSLLLDLESYTVCQGYPASELPPNQEPVLYVRAAACELLVPQSQERCDKCDITSLVL